MKPLKKVANASFEAFKMTYHQISQNQPEPPPVWQPSQEIIQQTNLYKAMQENGFHNYQDFYQWSIEKQCDFLHYTLKKLNIKFDKAYTDILINAQDVKHYQWFPNAKLNITNSCFQAIPSKIAIVFQGSNNQIIQLTYEQLQKIVNRLANSISKQFKKGDALAICMPMNIEAVALYLAVIKAGCCVVSIADSFSIDEIAVRLNISKAKGIFTQDVYFRNQKPIKIYDKIKQASQLQCVVVCQNVQTELRKQDQQYKAFISDNESFDAVSCEPNDTSNILFSSGTTGTPKAIPWTHTTPIRCAMDAFYHQDIQESDVVAWPTNLGWMMGPWLVYACFINGATMALSSEVPTQASFGAFIQDQKVSILGLVPSMVTAWETSKCMEAFDWSHIKCFSSSGECSSPEDYLYLMWLGECKPIIEYCGGTEIGGGYLSSTLIQDNTPAVFTTPTLGIQFVLLDEDQNIKTDHGEVALISPALGLSQTLLNRDHYEVYFAGMPIFNHVQLRRHGDYIQMLNNGFYQALGRIDDTMNLGGIKVSSAEIERVLNELDDVIETAAIAVPPKHGGPSLLVIYAISKRTLNQDSLRKLFQAEIKNKLNPLFKVHEVVIIDALPRTASNKIMRRILRSRYDESNK